MIGYLFLKYCTLYGCVKHTKEYKLLIMLFYPSPFFDVIFQKKL